MLLLTFLPVHSISSKLWSVFCSLYRIAFYWYIHSFRFGYVGDINHVQNLIWMKLLFNSPNGPKVRERGLSLSKESLHFFSFQLRCNPNIPDLNLVHLYTPGNELPPSTHLSLQVYVFGSYGCRIFLDGVIASTMCYMLYRRSSGFTAQ